MKKLYYRGFQRAMKYGMYALPWREPDVMQGEGSFQELPVFIQKKGFGRILVITDRGIVEAGLLNGFVRGLKQAGVEYALFDKTEPNPTIAQVEEAADIYRTFRCDAIVAIGGGSPIDCAKAAGARIANPKKTLPEMKGLLRVRKTLPFLIAVPTTAGTGSEATLAAVVSDSRTREKYALMDPALIPHAAVLDPLLTAGLPPNLTATTGMDALTHAVEAYIGNSRTAKTEQWSLTATRLIFANLYAAYTDGTNREARANMLQAAYLAGKAFTRSYVGNIHAIAHTLSGFYNTPHGLANAVLMPVVLKRYGEAVYGRLAELADAAGIEAAGSSDREKAEAFIEAIRDLNSRMEIPAVLAGIQEEDIPLMAKRAVREANPLYPVPVIYSEKEMESVIQAVRG